MKSLMMKRSFLAALVVVAAAGAARADVPPMDPKDIEPLKIHRTVRPIFPPMLQKRMVDEGEARILVMVDKDGRLADWMVTGYTHAPFAKEALDVLQKWKFEAATYQGKPINARAELRFMFRTEGIIRMVPADMVVEAKFREIMDRGGFWQRYVKSEELDRIPDTIVEVAPMPPDQLGAVAPEGKVVVDYYVDPEGKVRMPIILESSDEAFSNSVLLAMTEWRYEPPRRDSVPVMTRLWREFRFRQLRTAQN
jgi:TonB family protein